MHTFLIIPHIFQVGVNLGWCEVRGAVAYKGALAGKQGDWVGVHLEDKGKVKRYDVGSLA